MNILVTGGAGFIGSNLCKTLDKLGHIVFVIDNLSPQIHGENPEASNYIHSLSPNVQLIVGDILDERSYAKIQNIEFDAIVHLAAETGTGQSMYNSKKYCDVNISGLAYLNDLIVNKVIQKPKKIILSSSRAVYGEALLDNDSPIASKETDNTVVKSIYAITKLAQEEILFTGFNEIPVCALRFQNVFGPGQSLKNPYTGIISIFYTAMKNNKDIQIFEDGLMTRDFVYIDDIVDSILLVIENDNITNKQIFNVGSGQKTTVLEVAYTIKEKLNSNISISVTGEKRMGDIRHNFADISKINKTLQYTPKYTFSSGIDKFLEWAESQRKEESSYEDSLVEMRKIGLLQNS